MIIAKAVISTSTRTNVKPLVLVFSLNRVESTWSEGWFSYANISQRQSCFSMKKSSLWADKEQIFLFAKYSLTPHFILKTGVEYKFPLVPELALFSGQLNLSLRQRELWLSKCIAHISNTVILDNIASDSEILQSAFVHQHWLCWLTVQFSVYDQLRFRFSG